MDGEGRAASCLRVFVVTASSLCVLCGEFPRRLRDHVRQHISLDGVSARMVGLRQRGGGSYCVTLVGAEGVYVVSLIAKEFQ